MSEDKIAKEIKKRISEELDNCKDRADVVQVLMKFYVSMYASSPKRGRDILNEIEDEMKTDMVNFSLEKGFIPN